MKTFTLPVEYTVQKKAALERRLQLLQEVLASAHNLLILMHNDPDPDAMASALGMQTLMQRLCPDLKLTLAHGGIIGRAENQSMVTYVMPKLLRIPIGEAAQTLKTFDAVALIDTQPGAGNHLLSFGGYPLDKVAVAFDHHPPRRSQVQAIYHDVRPDVGACATLLCEYLATAGIVPDSKLATALFYGIKSDTRGLSRHAGELDAWAYMALHALLDTDLLATIEQAHVPESYFRNLSYALAHTYRYRRGHGQLNQPDAKVKSDKGEKTGKGTGTKVEAFEGSDNDENGDPAMIDGDVLISLLGDMERPDMAAEVADLLLRLEGVVWVVGLGLYEDRIVISVRCETPKVHAGRLVRSIVGRNGTAGGHEAMAGGRVHLPNATPAERTASLHSLVPLFLEKLGIADASAEQLLGG